LSWFAWPPATLAVWLAACGGPAFSTARGVGDDGGAGASSSGGGSSSGSSSGGSSGATGDGGGTDGPAGVESGAAEAGPGEGGAIEGGFAEGGPANPGVPCGPSTDCSGATPVCCLGSGTTPSCAHAQCGCATQLECASDFDCTSTLAPTCCINKVADATCTASHEVARCAAACLNGAQHLCDPNAQKQQCTVGTQCSTSGGDLSNVNLPNDGLYGVCK
jgi:hypothetical protein